MVKTDQELSRALSDACALAEILAAIAAVEYRRNNPGKDCPPDAIPTEDELRDWLSERLPYMHDEASRRLIALADAMRGPFMLDMSKNASPLPEKLPWWWTELWSAVEIEWHPDLPILLRSMFRIPSVPGPIAFVYDEDKGAFAYARLEEVHGTWRELESQPERLSHPFAPIVRAWQEWKAKQPQEVTLDERRTAIMPGGLFDWAGLAPAILTMPRHDNELPLRPGMVEPERQLALPTLEPKKSEIVPSPALVLAERAGLGALTGKAASGARLDKRLLVHALLGIEAKDRYPGGRYTLRPTLRKIVHEWGWPAPALIGTGTGSRSSWKPSKHAPFLRSSMNAVTLAGVLLEDGRETRPVMFRTLPDFNDLKSCARIEIALPESGSIGGPMLDRLELIAAGIDSDMAFDGELTLPTLWDRAKQKNAGHRIYATRPKALRDADGYLLAVLRGPDGAPVPDAETGEPQPVGRILGHSGNPFTGRDGKLQWRPGEAPQRDWRHPDALLIGEERHPHADRVPVLDRNDRRRLFYGHKSDARTAADRGHEAERAEARLRKLEAAGRVVIEDDGAGGWRILQSWRPDGSTDAV